MNFLRKFHLILGAILAPFLLVTGIAGLLTVSGYFNPTVFGLHNWRIVGRWLGITVASGLAFLAISGGVLYGHMRFQQFRRRRKKRPAAAGRREAAPAARQEGVLHQESGTDSRRVAPGDRSDGRAG
ncbi:MAG: hypothetical protein R6X12_04030 [bacterium]